MPIHVFFIYQQYNNTCRSCNWQLCFGASACCHSSKNKQINMLKETEKQQILTDVQTGSCQLSPCFF